MAVLNFANTNTFQAKLSQTFSKFKTVFKKNKNVSTKTGGEFKAFMSKLSGAFLLPISILAIAGLFLGIGATIASNSPSGSAGETFGNFVKQLGDPLFGALPLLFAAAIAISFTEEAGVAVFNSIVGYLIFSALQSVFIVEKDGGFEILFGGGWRTPSDLKDLVGTSLGFQCMQTSVFGGIIVGFAVQWAYKRFHTIQLPQIISFFGGKRFVALAVVVLMIPITFTFLLLWPYVGYIFNWIGKNSGKIPYGFDSFIFGFIERSLVPFGLHHVFYSPLWYTQAGGNVSLELSNWLQANSGNKILGSDLESLMTTLKGSIETSASLDTYLAWTDITKFGQGSVVGDSTTTLALIGVNTDVIHYEVGGQQLTKPLYMFVQDELGLKLGRFLDGKFSFMQWGLPFAGLAMVMAAPKENRKVALGTVFPAAITCFITGVTEPIEFTFLFLAPILFFGFHAFMCATSFLLANLLSVHIGMALSGGFLDLVIYGMIPMMKGTNFWWTIVVGMGYIPIYYFVFYFWIKKADLATPGRGGNTKLFTKKDYQAAKSSTNSSETQGPIEPQILGIIKGFGGVENITKTSNCATRLRFDVKDASKVDEGILKSFGAFGMKKVSDIHVQVIFGPAAEQLRVKIEQAIKEINQNPSLLGEIDNTATLQSNHSDETPKPTQAIQFKINSPAEGKIKTLQSIKDGVFSEKMLGNGFAIDSIDGKIYAPVSGKLVTVFPTKHAYGIQTSEGISVLIHIGIDTVSLDGKGFKSFVEQDQEVEQGQLIAQVDLKVLQKHKLIPDVICVVTTDSIIQPKDENIRKRGEATKDTIIIHS